MVEGDADSADHFVGAVHGQRAWAAGEVGKSAGAAGGKISCHGEAGAGRRGNTRAGDCQVIEIVGSVAADNCSSAAESQRTSAAIELAMVGPIAADGDGKGA